MFDTEYIVIGKFMGIEPCLCGCGRWKRSLDDELIHEDPDYHGSWDWIMPVVMQINSEYKKSSKSTNIFVGIRIFPDTIYLHIDNFRLTNVVGEGEGRFKTLLDALYNAVIEFLNYKNSKDE